MKNDRHIASYTADELRARRVESRTDLSRLDASTDVDTERLAADDADEAAMVPDWTRAKLILPEAKRSVHLRLEREVVEFFRAQGKGHIARMQAVLKAYVQANKNRAGNAEGQPPSMRP